MNYKFPNPKEIPYEVKQIVMNRVFPKKGSLIKRVSLVGIFSVSLSFLGVVILFSWLYVKPLLNSGADQKTTPIDNNVVSVQVVDVVDSIENLDSELSSQEIVVEVQTLDDVELIILEAETIISELESLI